MNKLIKYSISLLLSAAVIYFTAKFITGVYASGMNRYVGDITADVEAKRSALIATGVFHEGVTVNGVSIGGMTYDEAKEALKPVEEQLVKDVGFSVRYGSRDVLEIGKSYFRFTYDTESILDEAIMLASEGELEALRQEIDDIAANGRSYTITSTVEADEAAIEAAVRSVGDPLNVEPVEPELVPNPESVYDPDAERFSVVPGVRGYRSMTDEAVDEIIARARSHAYGTVYMEGEYIEPTLTAEDFEGRYVLRNKYTSSYNSVA